MRKVISTTTCDFLVASSQKLFNASQSGDPELAEAVLLRLKEQIDFYIQDLREGNTDVRPY
jgi:hypothetical protein